MVSEADKSPYIYTGLTPTGISFFTVLVVVLITDTESEPELAT